jgi:hypothetical protein
MNKKQKKVLKRIILSAILIIAFAVAGNFVSIPKVLEFVLYLIPYLVVNYAYNLSYNQLINSYVIVTEIMQGLSLLLSL